MKTCTVSELQRSLASGACRVIDVREAPEYEAEHIPGALLEPLSRLDAKKIKEILAGKGDIVLVCRSGVRASQAAEKLARAGACEPVVLSGGLNAWAQAGAETVKGASSVWDLERQVRFAAGLLVLFGVTLGSLVHANFFYLAGFVGAGLVFAAVTNTCGMAMLLAAMPWNRSRGVTCSRSADKAGASCGGKS